MLTMPFRNSFDHNREPIIKTANIALILVALVSHSGCMKTSTDSEAPAETAKISDSCNVVALDRAYVREQLGPGHERIMTKANLTIVTAGQQVMGFKYTSIDQASLLAKICLQNDDVLTSVNERKMDQPEFGFVLFDALVANSTVRIGVLRGIETKVFTINIQ